MLLKPIRRLLPTLGGLLLPKPIGGTSENYQEPMPTLVGLYFQNLSEALLKPIRRFVPTLVGLSLLNPIRSRFAGLPDLSLHERSVSESVSKKAVVV